MHLRRFTAENISKALEMVKAELGSEAVILSTEKKRKKDPESRGFVSYTEVVAAVDREEETSSSRISPAKSDAEAAKVQPPPQPLSLEKLSEEVSEIKKALSNMTMLLEKVLEQGGSTRDLPGPEPAGMKKGPAVQEMLSGLGIDPATASSLSKTILSSFSHHQITRDQIISWLSNYLMKHFRPGPAAENSRTPVWWAFIGPTGVGKTTTLAKIAARLKFLKKKTGLLVSVDSYRLGAEHQLRKYAQLMDLPLETARTTKELLRIFSIHRDKDFILVDTTGRNPFSSAHETELRRLFDAVPGLMAQVMLCSTYKREDLMESIDFYKTFPAGGWTLTKTDETRFPASAFFAVVQAGLSLSYMTNGQRVPEDIQVPRAEKLCSTLFAEPESVPSAGRQTPGHLNANVC